MNTANTDDIQAAVNNIMNLNFEDTSIKNAAVKSAMKKLNSASSKLTRAFNEYLDGTIEEKENSFWRLLFGCPINISVFNSSGEQIGYISDDDIWHTSAVKINRLGSAKEIIVLDHDTPSFVISATDYGEMSCSFEEYDSNFLPIGRLNYYSIPLTPGQDFSVTLVDNLEAHAEELAIESNGELIYPDADTICNVCGYTRTVNAIEPPAATEEAVAETENPHISENATATEALKPTTEASQENDEVSLSNDEMGNSDPNSFGVSGILIAALVIIMVGSLAGLATLFIYKRRHD